MFSYINGRIRAFVSVPEKKRLLENFLSLSVLQGANYILPLVTVPYLVRILGPEKFGLIAFAQAFVQYFGVLTNYGFNLSATRKISIYRENKERVSQIFSSVIFIKFSFMLLSLLVLVALIFAIPKFNNDWMLYLFTFGMVIGNVLFPVWFFQGMERMKYITFLNLLTRCIFTVAIFVFIRKQADYLYVPLISSLGAISTGILSLWIVWKDFETRLRIPSLTTVIGQLKDGWHIFISTVAISLYTTSNVFILGLFTNNTIVGYYSGGEKLIRAVRGLLIPVSQTIYPYISKLASESRQRALSFVRKSAKLVGSASFLISLALFIFAKPIVDVVLGDQYQKSIIVLRIQAFLPFIIGTATVYANFFLLGFGYSKEWSNIIIRCGLLSIIFAFILIYVLSLKHVGAAISVLATECLVLAFSYLSYKRLVTLCL